MSKIELLRTIKKLNTEGDEFLNSIPNSMSDIKALYCNNEYTNVAQMQKDALLKFVFGDLYEDICWFLYDWDPKNSEMFSKIEHNGKKYVIQKEDDYFDYLKIEHGIT